MGEEPVGKGHLRLVLLLHGFDAALRVLACVLLMSLLCCVMWGVITRAWGNPSIYTDEGTRFLMAWLAATGWMIAGRSRAHVRIRFFHDLLPAGLWEATELVIQLVIVVFGLSVAGLGVALVLRSVGLPATVLPISMVWLYFPLIPASLLMALQAVADGLWHRKRPADPDYGGEIG
jgi:TRAP-type C4-dicarboxylate transport system permease small subunit